ncbi:MAG: undecaprenyldiphospho-muramoylpentapeptide beta-N-acetylglucosaminyltransferase [Burkholderiales bacterium]
MSAHKSLTLNEQRLTKNAQRTLLVMAGGTGGHVFPALAVADYLKSLGWNVVWLGTKSGMEARLVPQHGYEMEWVTMAGLRGKGLLRQAIMPFMLLLAMAQSLAVIVRRRPNAVLGMGGFTALPGGLMASLLARPLVIHEQNSVAGLSNRVLAGLADKVLVAFPQAFEHGREGWKRALPQPKSTEWCGNPVRTEIAALPLPEQRYAERSGPPKLLVVGGSLGAAALNRAVPQALALLPENERPEVVHQAGRNNDEAVRAAYRSAGVAAEVRAFLDDMAQEYARCDLVICRAGALTVAELAAAGVASVLVPFPHAVDDHQTGNARFLSERGAAVLLPQAELTAERLAEVLCGLSREKLLNMAQAARGLGKPDATRLVADVCIALAA